MNKEGGRTFPEREVESVERQRGGWRQEGGGSPPGDRTRDEWSGNDNIKRFFKNISGKIFFSEPLSRYTTFRVGGPADVLFFPKDVLELSNVFSFVIWERIPYFILGQGSNLLFSDEGFRGVIFNLSHFDEIEILEKNSTNIWIKVGAGVDKKRLLNWAVDRGIAGLEFLSGVPGQIGGGLFMNAGTDLGDFSKITEKIYLLNQQGEVEELLLKSGDFSYRSQSFCCQKIILASVFRLGFERPVILKDRVERFLNDRKEKQPLGYPSCGSTFKNPPFTQAGRLIEMAGCKGYRVGNASISEKHANFIINHGGATAGDILAIIDHVKKRVKDVHSIELEEEVVIVRNPAKEFLRQTRRDEVSEGGVLKVRRI